VLQVKHPDDSAACSVRRGLQLHTGIAVVCGAAYCATAAAAGGGSVSRRPRQLCVPTLIVVSPALAGLTLQTSVSRASLAWCESKMRSSSPFPSPSPSPSESLFPFPTSPLYITTACCVCRYGFAACLCNISAAVMQYVIGRLSKMAYHTDWPYQHSWMALSSVMLAGLVLSLVQVLYCTALYCAVLYCVQQ
jgi:hypothetical protein